MVLGWVWDCGIKGFEEKDAIYDRRFSEYVDGYIRAVVNEIMG